MHSCTHGLRWGQPLRTRRCTNICGLRHNKSPQQGRSSMPSCEALREAWANLSMSLSATLIAVMVKHAHVLLRAAPASKSSAHSVVVARACLNTHTRSRNAKLVWRFRLCWPLLHPSLQYLTRAHVVVETAFGQVSETRHLITRWAVGLGGIPSVSELALVGLHDMSSNLVQRP